MIKEYKKARIGSFFLTRFCGIGIMFDFEPLICGNEKKLFAFELKFLYYKLWIIKITKP